MSFISGFTELFKGKKTEAQPVVPPQISIEEKRKDASNLEAMMSQGGADFRNPADAKRLEELRAQITEMEASQAPQPQVETQLAQPTTAREIPQGQPAEKSAA